MHKLIQQITVVYLALIVLIRMMAMPLSLLDYSINQRFIAQNLCENRMSTAIQCGGKCFLNKQLARTSENQESSDQKGPLKIIIVDFFEPFNKPELSTRAVRINHNGQFQARRIINPWTGNIFHPPIA